MSKDHTTADVAFIKALAELLNENDLTEIAVKREYGENDTLNVRVSKQVQMVSAPVQPVAMAAAAPMPMAGAAPAAAAAPAPSGDPSSHPGVVASPMVGTVYMAAEPGAEPFVAIGSQVSAGQTVLIIEAMKTMNHIPAPASGVVKRILVADGSPVEYGAPLMIIE